MKNKTWILLKAQFLSQSGVNSFLHEKDQKKKNRSVAFAASMVILAFVMVFYSFGIGYGLGSIGLASVIPGCAFTLTSLLVLFFTLFKAGGTLFAFRDYDALMALPVKTSSVISSRFFLMYGWNALFSLGVMLPMGISYCYFVKPQALFYVMWGIAIFAAPLVPMTVATVISAIISAVASRFKHTNVVSILLSFILLIGFLGASMSTGTLNSTQISVKQLAQLGDMISQKMNQSYPLTGLFEKAIHQNDILSFLAFLTISVVWYWLFVKLVSIPYKAINTGLTTHQSKSNYKLQGVQTASPFQALYRKELKRFFSSNLYVLNMGCGAVLMLAASIACLVLGIDQMTQMFQIPNIQPMIVRVVPFVLCGMLGMTCTSCVSLSLEGKNLWILQTLPVKAATVYKSKMAVNATVLLPCVLLSSLFMSICLKADVLQTLWLFVTPLVFTGFTCAWGIFINLKIPNFTWEAEVTVIKQSMAAMVGLLGTMIIGLLPIAVLLVFSNVNANLLTGIITLLFAVGTVLLYQKVCASKLPVSES